MANEIDKQTSWLFNRQYDDNTTEEQDNKILELAEEQISAFGWDETFKSWKKYLFTECKTPESAINFANLFWWFAPDKYSVPEPYEFLAYFYYRIDFNVEKYDDMGILDSLATAILVKAGHKEADRMFNADYIPELDPGIIAEAQACKSSGL